MKPFVEKRIVNIMQNTSIILGLLFFLELILAIFDMIFLEVGFGFLILSVLFSGIAYFISDKERYTTRFLEYMRIKLDKAKTLSELQEIEWEFTDLAIKGKTYCLSYPTSLKEIHLEIKHKIQILEIQVEGDCR